MRTEQWLRSQPQITQDYWREVLKRGITDKERIELKAKVKAWIATLELDPDMAAQTEIR